MKHVSRFLIALVAACVPALSSAQSYPNKPISEIPCFSGTAA